MITWPTVSLGQEVHCSSNDRRSNDQSWLSPPISPTDFTAAFNRVKPWVLSVAAGDISVQKRAKRRPKKVFTAKSEGSAIIWGDDKYVLTNAHVIKGYTELRARTAYQRVVRLELVAMYEALDVAILRTKTSEALSDLPSACYYEELPPVGSWVAAVGHPYSMPYSLSSGVVSAHHRGELLSEWASSYPGFIQTNITLNPGNSGGPLIDQRGVMVGMNTAVRQGATGMSLSLPMSRLLPILSLLINHRKFDRSFIGLTLSKVSYQRAQKAGLVQPRGVRVKRVREDGPAHLAGLRRNDIILRVNGRRFDHPCELSWYLISAIPNVPMIIEMVRSAPHINRGVLLMAPLMRAPKLLE